MYFNFSRLSETMEQLPEKLSGFSLWSQLSSFSARLTSAISGVARSYAQTYALVQQSQYDKDGNIKDVTSPERVTVPDNILAGTRASLNQLKVEIRDCTKPSTSFTATGEAKLTNPKSFLYQFQITIDRATFDVDMVKQTVRIANDSSNAAITFQSNDSSGITIPLIGFPIGKIGDRVLFMNCREEGMSLKEDWIQEEGIYKSIYKTRYAPVNGAGVTVAITCSDSGNYYLIFVADDGSGMYFRFNNGSAMHSLTFFANEDYEGSELEASRGPQCAPLLGPTQQVPSLVAGSFEPTLYAAPSVSVQGTGTATVVIKDVFTDLVNSLPVDEVLACLQPEE